MTLAARGAEAEQSRFCGKVPFSSSQEAMFTAKRAETRGHPPATAYRCPTVACRRDGVWHLTSGHGSPRELLDWGGKTEWNRESNATTSTTAFKPHKENTDA